MGGELSEVALAWIYAQGRDLVPIPGTKRRAYLEENVAGLEVQLGNDELEQLAAVASPVGDRYPDMSPVNR